MTNKGYGEYLSHFRSLLCTYGRTWCACL